MRSVKNAYRYTAPHLILILLIGFLAYSNTLEAPFVFDDIPNIVENPLVKDISNFTSEPSDEGVVQGVYQQFHNRIVGHLTLALNYRAQGFNVKGYHTVNLAIHLTNALLVYWLVILSFRTPFLLGSRLSERSQHIALIASVIFVAHPIQTQAVTYIVQRFTSLATLFYLLSLCAYVKARLCEGKQKYWFLILSLLSAVLAMKTKEISFTLPVVVVLYELLFLNGRLTRRIAYLIPILLTLPIIPLGVMGVGNGTGGIAEATRVYTSMSRIDYLLTQFRVVTTYIRLLLFPINQNLDYDYPEHLSFTDPAVFLSIALILAIMCFAIALLYRSRTSEPALRIVGFGLLWFFVTLSVESSIIPIIDVIYEHRLYLPSVGAFSAVAIGAALALNRLRTKNAFKVGVALVVAVSVVLAAGTYRRNAVWGSSVSFWSDVTEKSPRKERGHNNLGAAYLDAGMLDEAIKSFLKAKELNPQYTPVYFNLGEAYLKKGIFGKSIENYSIFIFQRPDNEEAHRNIAKAYRKIGMDYKARKHIRIADSLKDRDAHPDQQQTE